MIKQNMSTPLIDSNKADGFRLQRISEIHHRLKKERDFRDSLYKKYQRSVNVMMGIDTTLITVGLGLGAGAIFAGPFLVALEATAGVCGALGIACKFVGKKLHLKAKKHNEIRVLAESKLNTISDLISKALIDDTISDQEFHLILSEANKYEVLKTNIRAQANKQLITSKAEKQELIQRGKNKVMLTRI